jgi:Flp pilus assembly protein protease CpaA
MADSPSQLAALFALLTVASAWDVVRRRIPNALTIGIAASGLAVQLAARGPRLALASLGAAVIVLAVLWIPWGKRAIGGGDLKLAGGAAAWVGLAALPRFALASLVAAGVLAVGCYLLSARAARAEIRANLCHAALGLGARPVIVAAGRVPVPAGVAIAAGAIAAVLAGR